MKRFLGVFCVVILVSVFLHFNYFKMLVTGEFKFKGQSVLIGETIRLDKCKRWVQQAGEKKSIVLGPGAEMKVVRFGEKKQLGPFVEMIITNQGELGACFDDESDGQIQSFYQKESVKRGISILIEEYLQLRIKAKGGVEI